MRRLLPLEARVAQALRAAGLAGRAAPLLVAASGGPDSTALLAALASLRGRLGVRPHVVHVNHGLRPEAAADAAYVRRLARRWRLPVSVRRADVLGRRRARRLSLEEAARQARYAILAQVAHEVGAGAVLVAHTADDQVETILLGLLRGAGLRGMAGMAPLAPLPPVPGEPPPPAVPLVRPLLEVRREEVEAYLRLRRLRPRRDPSNMTADFLRNRLRAELLPLLEELRPGARDALRRAGAAAREALSYLEEAAEEAWESVVRRDGEALHLRKEPLGRLPPVVRTSLLQRAVATVAGAREGYTARHWQAMERLAAPGGASRSIQLPHGLRLAADATDVTLTVGEPPIPLPLVETTALAVPGEATAGGWVLCAGLLEGGGLHLEAGLWDPSTTLPPLPGPLAVLLPPVRTPDLVVRARRPGDRIVLASGSRKLQDLLTDAKVPRSWRDRLPVVLDSDSGSILWVVGVAAAPAESTSGHPMASGSTMKT